MSTQTTNPKLKKTHSQKPQQQPPPLVSKQEQFFKKFREYMNDAKEKQLINGINNYHGKNFPIDYKQKYNFSQRWEGQLQQHMIDDYLLQDDNLVYSILCFIIVIFNSYCIWALSIQRYFGITMVTQQVGLYQIAISKLFMRCKNQQGQFLDILSILKLICKQISCILYFIYLFFQGGYDQTVLQISCELFITYIMWSQCSLMYQRFKVKGQAIKYQNQLKIIDLLINVLAQTHIFAIIMYSTSKIEPSSSWTLAIGIQNASQFTQYIYSCYFACTTMLTIGYGDITPQNQYQIIVVILIEITGVLSFGYLLNEMGHTLSMMRQKQQQLQKDLQTVSKMANFYNLQKKLVQQAKSFLLTNQTPISSLKPSDENSLLMKFNEQLREEIAHENSLSIVKSCIFFLCNWSKTFQLEIAKRLQKKLISPNQKLGEIIKNERMYIIKQGKIQIFMNKFGPKSNKKKLLKVISISPLSEVSDNLYGYTLAFSNRPVFLQAIAREFTSTYSITKDDFLQCVSLDVRDFQYFHQIKCKIDQAQFCQEWETPTIRNIREHYMPSRIFLIKKYKKQLMVQINIRDTQKINRRDKYKFFLIDKLRRKDTNRHNNFIALSEKTLQFEDLPPEIQRQIEQNRIKYQLDIVSGEESIVKQIQEDSLSIAMQHARQFLKTTKKTLALQQKQNKKLIAYQFQTHKTYTNFFPKNNITNVLIKLQKDNYLQRRMNNLKQ